MRIRLGHALVIGAVVPLGACWLSSGLDVLLEAQDASMPDGSTSDVQAGDGPAADGRADAAPGDGATGDASADAPAPVDGAMDGPPDAPIDAGCFTDAYATSVLFDKPLAYYRLDEQPNATMAADSSGHGNTGTYKSVTLGVPGAIVTDPSDTAADFDGTTSIVTVGTQLSFQGTMPFSVEAWIYPKTTDGEYRGILSSESTSLNPRYGYLLYVEMADMYNGFERWGGAASNPIKLTGMVTKDAWFHIVGTFDPNAPQSHYMNYYVNGVDVLFDKNTPVSIGQADTFVIGALNGGSMANPSFFLGSIDEVAVYDHALDPACVVEHYKLGTGQ